MTNDGITLMKLLENVDKFDGSIQQAVKQMILDIFGEELEDDHIENLVKELSLSDIIALDRAYTHNNREEISNIIGPLPQMEYSMGVGRQATSTASNRPGPNRSVSPSSRRAQFGRLPAGHSQSTAQINQPPAVEPGPHTGTQTTRNYSSGASNPVTTTNINRVGDDPDELDQEEIDLAETPSLDRRYLIDPELNLIRLAREYQAAMARNSSRDEHDIFDDMLEIAKTHGLDILDFIDPEDGPDLDSPEMDIYTQFELDRIHSESESKEAVEESTNIVDMVKWLKRRAGIA